MKQYVCWVALGERWSDRAQKCENPSIKLPAIVSCISSIQSGYDLQAYRNDFLNIDNLKCAFPISYFTEHRLSTCRTMYLNLTKHHVNDKRNVAAAGDASNK
jgi:hypothetical protein